MVVTRLPLAALTGVTQERIGSPSRCTVQAPQSAMPHPYLVPVSPSTSRSTHSNGMSASASTATFLPLRLRLIMGLRSRGGAPTIKRRVQSPQKFALAAFSAGVDVCTASASALDPLQCTAAEFSLRKLTLERNRLRQPRRCADHDRDRHHWGRTLRAVPGFRAGAARHRCPCRRLAPTPGRAVRRALPRQAHLRYPGATGLRGAGAGRSAAAADQALQGAAAPWT